MIRRPPRSTLSSSSAASDVYKRQGINAEYGDSLKRHSAASGRFGNTLGMVVEFKRPLEELVDDEHPIPLILQSAIEHIEHTSLHCEGLWRKPGSGRQMTQLIKANAATGEDIVWQSVKTIENVTGIAGKFLKQVPGGVIDNLEVIDELLHHGEEPEIILAALQRLDKNRQAVIQAVIRHLHAVALNSSRNKMSPDALATCVAMALIDERKLCHDMASAQKMLGLMRPISMLIKLGDIETLDSVRKQLAEEKEARQQLESTVERLELMIQGYEMREAIMASQDQKITELTRLSRQASEETEMITRQRSESTAERSKLQNLLQAERTLCETHEKTAATALEHLAEAQQKIKTLEAEKKKTKGAQAEEQKRREASLSDRLEQERAIRLKHQRDLQTERAARASAEVARKAAIRSMDQTSAEVENVRDLKQQLLAERLKIKKLEEDAAGGQAAAQPSVLLTQRFRQQDTDGNGLIGLEEMIAADRQFCAEFQLPFDETACKAHFKDSDVNKDGLVTFEEFVEYQKCVLAKGLKESRKAAAPQSPSSPSLRRISSLQSNLEREQAARAKAEHECSEAVEAANVLKAKMDSKRQMAIGELDREMVHLMGERTEQTMEDLIQAQFALHDINDDGKISLDEMMAADRVFCQEFGLSFDSEQCRASFNESDTDHVSGWCVVDVRGGRMGWFRWRSLHRTSAQCFRKGCLTLRL
eukprot:TRINITY_DN1664_c0_g2_i4.p1 TRINITY_DN1664_c0_g2~~TRINITY_DN1664_c0_g2_i4.p1  ORF type:complete len:705 (-),score=140.65 TRINITY_DN1664_c0_g2_i4:226-2340(-)